MMILNAVRAELRRMLHWPSLWVLCGVWLALNLTFAYVFPYLTYRSGSTVGPGETTGTLALLLPARAPVATVQGLPLFGGALVLVLGALAMGSGYGWGTWKTVFTAGPRRAVALTGTLLALLAVLAGLVLATLAVDLAAATTVAVMEHQQIVLPGTGDTVRGLGTALMIGLMWTLFGVLIGALTRGPALAVGLGLVWTLVVENLLRTVARLLDPLQTVTNMLPGTAAGSLAAAAGALPQGTPDGTPGVNTVLDGRTAAFVLAGYLLAFAVGSVGLLRHRDMAG
jgi:ABC-type transport system involved in multi-copper enzyme maturation permease subunit